MKTLVKILCILMLSVASAFCQGTILWDESINGPFSQDSGSPTSLAALTIGTNSIVGMTEIVPTGPSWSLHPDFFKITVPDNYVLTSIFVNLDKPNVWTWIGNQGFVNQLGFSFSPSSGELLAQLGLGSIAASTYGMYLENHDAQTFTSVANYRLDFFVQSIPEPGTLSLFFVGIGFIGFAERRRFGVRSI